MKRKSKSAARKLKPVVLPEGLVGAIYVVWSQIGHDVEQCAADCGETVDNESAVESCIDADRLEMYGPKSRAKELSKALDKMIAEHGYPRVLRAISKVCRLS